MSNFVFISIETTGLDSIKDRIVEIAALKIDNKSKIKTLFHQYYNPEIEISAKTSGFINLTNSFLKTCPLFHEKVDTFLEFIRNSKLVMHNKSFIMKFIACFNKKSF